MGFIKRVVASGLNSAMTWVTTNPKLRVLLYDLRNRSEFSNLYEHEKMLADSVRVKTYQRAIEKHIHAGDTVLDLGTGTGILALFAAKQQAKKIIAVDHSDFIEVAREIARHNNIDSIEFIQCNSRNVKTDIKFDVLLHEQIGDYLFNENMIENILDLKRRLLKKEGKILPGKFELFIEPVCLNPTFNVPFIWENEFYGIDFKFLKDRYETLEQYETPDYRQEWLDSSAVEYLLCEPSPVLSFDLNTLESEKSLPHSLSITKQLTRPGTLDGLCMFFKVIFDEEIWFDTSPLTKYTHWGNCLFRVESQECLGGEVIDYKISMPDFLDITCWKVSIKRFRGWGPGRA